MVLTIHAHYYAAHESTPSLIQDLEYFNYSKSTRCTNSLNISVPFVKHTVCWVIFVDQCIAMNTFCRLGFFGFLLSAHVYYKKATIKKIIAGQTSAERLFIVAM